MWNWHKLTGWESVRNIWRTIVNYKFNIRGLAKWATEDARQSHIFSPICVSTCWVWYGTHFWLTYRGYPAMAGRALLAGYQSCSSNIKSISVVILFGKCSQITIMMLPFFEKNFKSTALTTVNELWAKVCAWFISGRCVSDWYPISQQPPGPPFTNMV